MEKLRDTARASGGGVRSTEPARSEVPPMPPEMIGVRRVAVAMEAMQVADIEKNNLGAGVYHLRRCSEIRGGPTAEVEDDEGSPR